jgi:hypothetical protein
MTSKTPDENTLPLTVRFGVITLVFAVICLLLLGALAASA